LKNSIIALLEKLAQYPEHHPERSKLLNSLPLDLQNIFLSNDAEALKKQLSSVDRFANESHVFNA
jgi:hypothetical protein